MLQRAFISLMKILGSFCVYTPVFWPHHKPFLLLLPLGGGSVFTLKESGINCAALRTC